MKTWFERILKLFVYRPTQESNGSPDQEKLRRNYERLRKCLRHCADVSAGSKDDFNGCLHCADVNCTISDTAYELEK